MVVDKHLVMERSRQPLVRQPYQISLVAREPHPLVQLVRRHDERGQVVRFLLPQKLVQLLGEADARHNVHVGEKHVPALATLARHVAQMVLRVRVLDAPLARVRLAQLQQIVQCRLRFGTVKLGEIAHVHALEVRRRSLPWQHQMEAYPLPDRPEAGPQIGQVDLHQVQLIVARREDGGRDGARPVVGHLHERVDLFERTLRRQTDAVRVGQVGKAFADDGVVEDFVQPARIPPSQAQIQPGKYGLIRAVGQTFGQHVFQTGGRC